MNGIGPGLIIGALLFGIFAVNLNYREAKLRHELARPVASEGE